jgi:DNA-binding transcriptional ArsR family regulator
MRLTCGAWATVWRHLTVLREADLVVAERDGQAIRYELNTSVFQDVLPTWRTR